MRSCQLPVLTGAAALDRRPGHHRSQRPYFQTRFEIASTIVDRAIARGEIPDGALAIEMLIAPLHFRTLVSHQPLDEGLPARLADLVISGLGTR
jgi:hypothetical protein